MLYCVFSRYLPPFFLFSFFFRLSLESNDEQDSERSNEWLIVENFLEIAWRTENRAPLRPSLRGTFEWRCFQLTNFHYFSSEVKPKANRKTISDNVNLPVHAIRHGVCARGRASKDTRIRPALWIFCDLRRGKDRGCYGAAHEIKRSAELLDITWCRYCARAMS